MRSEYCDYVLAALRVRYCDCCAMSLWPPVMRSEYCDYVLAALRVRYCDCCAMSLWHQVCPVLCIVYQVLGLSCIGC